MASDAKVPDLLLDVECPHNPTVYSTSGVAGVPIPCEVRPRDCDDCIRLALAAAKAEGRREALRDAERLVEQTAFAPLGESECALLYGIADAIRALSRAGGEESR